MKKTLIRLLMLSIMSLSLATSAMAGNKQDAVMLIDKALVSVSEKGMEQTLKIINDSQGPFVKGDLYIFVMEAVSNSKIITLAHLNPKMLGKNMAVIKDKRGDRFMIKMATMARKKNQGWVSYWWPKPGEKKPSEKVTYVKMVPDTKIFFGCGYYK